MRMSASFVLVYFMAMGYGSIEKHVGALPVFAMQRDLIAVYTTRQARCNSPRVKPPLTLELGMAQFIQTVD